MDGSRTLYWFDPPPMRENRTEHGFQFGRVRVRFDLDCNESVTSELTTSIGTAWQMTFQSPVPENDEGFVAASARLPRNFLRPSIIFT
ncbi:unnamed protein product [Musa banksii]